MKSKKKFEFSKLILVFETLLVLYTSYEIFEITRLCIDSQFIGSLPFLTTLISTVWAAYGTSVSFYYKKSEKENIPKVTTTMEIEKAEAFTKLYNLEDNTHAIYNSVTNNVDCDTL